MATWLMAANGLCGAMASMARRSTAGLSVSSSPPTGLTPSLSLSIDGDDDADGDDLEESDYGEK